MNSANRTKMSHQLYLLLLTAAIASSQTYNFGYSHRPKQLTRKIVLKQGVLHGIVVEPRINHALRPVEQYLGIPYAAPPVGELRFMPPGSAPSWSGVKYADMMGPVCPQKLPDLNGFDPNRKDYYGRLFKYLENQSEDCLYLNIYAPVQENNMGRSKYPVMVFVHGESYEWNSGNPYDGSVLAAYGKVIVVTLNFRLGILGFLKVGLDDSASSNFGLVDQVAALLWVQENIFHFGGDPNAITLFGHGTGAACISLLMLSPIVARDGKPLFHRAILMSGTALADWALAGTSRQITYQVAEALNCPTDAELAACLRKKRISDIMEVTATTRDYTTRFGPLVDGRVIPNDPSKIMSTYNDFFRRFELMYGVTEIESVHLLSPVGLNVGLLEKERDQELRKYLYARCEYKPEMYLAHTLDAYSTATEVNEQMRFTGHEPDRASLARDVLLDMLSDARTVAPMALTARYHAALNPQSYFYVFGHRTAFREFIRNKTAYGEELPYIFGVPLDGPKFHFADRYNDQERLFSEVIMTFWTNFAYSGDPNIPRKSEYMSLNALDWRTYEVDWPEYDRKNGRYLYLAIPVQSRQHYRVREVNYWNEKLPSLLNKNNMSASEFFPKVPLKPTLFPMVSRPPSKNIPPWFPYGRGTSTAVTDKFPRKLPERKPNDDIAYGKIKLKEDDDKDRKSGYSGDFGTVISSPPQAKTGGTAMIVLIGVGGVFLLINVILFVTLYYKCTRLKTQEELQKRIYGDISDVRDNASVKLENNSEGCGLMRIISRSSKSEDTYEAVKTNEADSSKFKLTRQMSASTIDPHTKVRDWIAHEIVQRCSPTFLRKQENAAVNRLNDNREKTATLKRQNQHVRTDSKTTESYSTLGKSPTRPVSPLDAELKSSSLPKAKCQKVSVAVDATPAARSPSILKQQPIELTKSLDYSTNRNDDDDDDQCQSLKRSATLSNLPNFEPGDKIIEPSTVVKIEHHHTKSDPSPPESYGWRAIGRNLSTFDTGKDVNVTSREEDDNVTPLTPEESLQTIKRRNFPKVLPDYPDRQFLMQKRRSMPAASPLFMPIPENPSLSQPSSPSKLLNKNPPAPPPRGCSTLGRKPVNIQPIITSSTMRLAEASRQGPEVICSSFFVGPLMPATNTHLVDSQPIYDNLRKLKSDGTPKEEVKQPDPKPAKTIITTDPLNPIKIVDNKILIKPTTAKSPKEKPRGIPRVVMKDAYASMEERPKDLVQNKSPKSEESNENSPDINETEDKGTVKVKTPSQIPKLIKNTSTTLNKESSSESSPSEESETGTVIKRV